SRTVILETPLVKNGNGMGLIWGNARLFNPHLVGQGVSIHVWVRLFGDDVWRARQVSPLQIRHV
ncbi:MAG: hypothetical protein ACOYL5_19965, partial [Phototrophicaceae bacterium]